MKIKIIGTESLGVRGLCCTVEFNNRKIIIDPGIALGYVRNGLKPHPLQVAVGKIIRDRIIKELKTSTDIVISHFHGDHVPLVDANPYQLSINQVGNINKNCKIWAKKENSINNKMKAREEAILFGLNQNMENAEGKIDENIFFSQKVPHGLEGTHLGEVIMTCVKHKELKFLHASDLQFLDEKSIEVILDIGPNVLLASGPPVYLEDYMNDKKELAWNNLFKVSNKVDTLILDHHLLRSEQGISWLDKLNDISNNKVICAADYMKKERHLLEAWRGKLYKDIPIEDDWHDIYENNGEDLDKFLNIGREKYNWFQY